MKVITSTHLNITYLKSEPLHPGDNELTHWGLNSRYFADIFKYILLKENLRNLDQISLKLQSSSSQLNPPLVIKYKIPPKSLYPNTGIKSFNADFRILCRIVSQRLYELTQLFEIKIKHSNFFTYTLQYLSLCCDKALRRNSQAGIFVCGYCQTSNISHLIWQ